MSYKTRRFKEGLSGKKPGQIYIGEKGHKAQEAGYKAFLTNQDLAERISDQERQGRSEYDGYVEDPEKPLELWQQLFWGGIGSALILFGWALSTSFAKGTTVLLLFLTLPGGLFVWPGVGLIFFALGSGEKSNR
jgi:hypothetical protein